jgi:two-component system cell cycle sensor histidine kinase/response regulator CckA
LKKGRPTIALIEDEPAVRMALASGIDFAGYTVISAASGVEGLALLEDPATDLAIIDIVLPGRMDGIAVAREAKRHNPGLRMIFMSGHPPPTDVSGLGEFVAKPVRLATLLDAIARQLGLEPERDP